MCACCNAGVDVTCELVGGDLRAALLPHLARGGRLLQIGYISEYPHTKNTPLDRASAEKGPAAAGEPCGSGFAGGSKGSLGSSDKDAGGAVAASAAAAAGGSTVGTSSCAASPEELFWRGGEVDSDGRRIIGSIWPKDLLAIRRCRKRVFDLYAAGKLDVCIDHSRAFRGIESIMDAVEHMLQGRHVGKVVVQIDGNWQSVIPLDGP